MSDMWSIDPRENEENYIFKWEKCKGMTRDEAIKILSTRDNRGFPITWQDGFVEAYKMAIEALEHLNNIEAYMHDFDVTEEEAIKALERKKGEWIKISIMHDERDAIIHEWQSAKCSVCGTYHTTPSLYKYNIKLYNYCPNCGSYMRGEDNE